MRRINTRIVVDIESNGVVERESVDYDGSVALAWGGGSTEVNAGNSVVWAQRPEEQGSFDLFGGIIEQMLEDQGYELKKTPRTDAGPREAKYELSLEKRPLTEEQQQERDLEAKIADYYGGVLGGNMNDVPTEIKAYIDQIYGDQDRMAKERLMQMGVEMAGSRGLNLSDTPIGQPLLHEYANIQSQLGAARAGSYLSERSNEIARAQAFREFQANLNNMRQYTIPNAMASQVANLGLGLYQPRFRGGVGATTPATSGAIPALNAISGTLGGLSNLAGVKINNQGGTLGGAVGAGLSSLFGGIFGGGSAG